MSMMGRLGKMNKCYKIISQAASLSVVAQYVETHQVTVFMYFAIVYHYILTRGFEMNMPTVNPFNKLPPFIR